MFEIIFLFFTAAYFIILIFLSSGLMKKIKTSKDFSPKVSVIVAARNEEENLTECMQSLYNQTYDKHKYEVIIADDFSSDNTAGIIKNFIHDKNLFRVITPDSNNKYTGKTNALISAIYKSDGEILLFTDADCQVPPEWISRVVSYYSNSAIGMVNGFSTIKSKSIFDGMQSTDLLFLISVAAGMSNNGFPVSCIGNNMSIRRSVYDETGGYDKINLSVTEDYMLINAVNDLKKYSILFPADDFAVVETKGLTSFSDIIAQKKRWASGGMSVPNISLGLMGISYITNLLVILSFFFMSSQVLTLLIVKISSEFFFLYNISGKLKINGIKKYFLFFEIYYLLYTLVLPVILLFNRKIMWKGRTY